MAWSTVYTQAYSTSADNHTFLTYFFDTYLSGKSGWTTGSHPSGSSTKRVASLTLPSPWENGANATCYYWIDWISPTSSSYWTWYEDATYTTTPGDLGTDTTNGWTSNGASWSSNTGDWRIWESSTDSNAIMLTKGRKVYFYWPGSSEWMVRVDSNWDGSTDNRSTHIGPYIGQSPSGLAHANYPLGSGTSGTKYVLVPDLGNNTTSFSSMPGGPYWFLGGVAWLFSDAASGTSTVYPDDDSSPALPRTGADTAWFYYDGNTQTSRNFIANAADEWAVLLETNTNKYWMIGNSDVNKQCLAFDMGATEPDLS